MKKLSLIFFILLSMNLSCYGAFFTKQPDNAADISKGYVGKLPDLTREHKPSEPTVSPPIFDRTQEFNSSNQVKPAPQDNPAFVNIILKQDKTSPYLNDLREFLDMLEQVYESIESGENIQRFAARVYYLYQNAEYFKDKYADKPESNFISYEKVIQVSLDARKVSELRTEAEKNKPYLAYTGSGSVYSQNNINEQLSFLKTEVENIINMIKEAN